MKGFLTFLAYQLFKVVLKVWYCTRHCTAILEISLYSDNDNSSMKSQSRLNPVGLFRTHVLLALAWLAISPVNVFAVVVDGLFEVQIPVPDETRRIRQAALADGLAEIMVRLSGDRAILQKIKPPAANAYVKQFRYVEIDLKSTDTASNPADSPYTHTLWVQYNSTKIMDLLRKNTIPIWGEHRSQAVVWFAVRDGSNQYVLREQDVSLLKTKTNEAFERRGIPAVWPRNDSRDQQQLHFAELWAGFSEPLQKASERYTSGPVISASMTWNGASWVGDWSLFMGDDSRRWTLNDADYTELISQAVDVVADAMGQKFAVLEATDETGLKQILVEVDQVESVKKLRHVQKYLTSLPVVQSMSLSQVEPERVAFKLTLRSEIEDFLKLIQADTQMVPLVTADAELSAGVSNTIYRFKLSN